MPKLTRRKLLCATAPLAAAAPLGVKLSLDGEAEAARARPLVPPDDGVPHRTTHAMGHAAMIGDGRAGGRRPERSRRAPLPAARAAVPAGPGPRLHARRDRRGDRDRARRLLPRLDVQRHRPGPGDPRDRGRPPARPLRQRRLAPAHDPLPRDPPDEHGRRLRDRRARATSSRTSSRRGPRACTCTTATRRRSRSTSTRASTARSSSTRRSRASPPASSSS